MTFGLISSDTNVALTSLSNAPAAIKYFVQSDTTVTFYSSTDTTTTPICQVTLPGGATWTTLKIENIANSYLKVRAVAVAGNTSTVVGNVIDSNCCLPIPSAGNWDIMMIDANNIESNVGTVNITSTDINSIVVFGNAKALIQWQMPTNYTYTLIDNGTVESETISNGMRIVNVAYDSEGSKSINYTGTFTDFVDTGTLSCAASFDTVATKTVEVNIIEWNITGTPYNVYVNDATTLFSSNSKRVCKYTSSGKKSLGLNIRCYSSALGSYFLSHTRNYTATANAKSLVSQSIDLDIRMVEWHLTTDSSLSYVSKASTYKIYTTTKNNMQYLITSHESSNALVYFNYTTQGVTIETSYSKSATKNSMVIAKGHFLGLKLTNIGSYAQYIFPKFNFADNSSISSSTTKSGNYIYVAKGNTTEKNIVSFKINCRPDNTTSSPITSVSKNISIPFKEGGLTFSELSLDLS